MFAPSRETLAAAAGREGGLMFEQCRWLNEPDRWAVTPDGLKVTTNQATDFWRETHYGFTRDSGHFFGREVAGEFTAALRVRAQYETLYDQAGIMVRLDEAHWIKAGIELADGESLLGSVLTIGKSDWAVGSFRGDASDVWIRVTVSRGVLRLQASADGRRWPLVRLCPFPVAERFWVGPMCCTPQRAGLDVLFSDFTVTPPRERALHDLS
jgi:regulation of enolase protein 1 (concanavalin A-like superfamily)